MDAAMLKWLDKARIDIKNQGESNDLAISVLVGNSCNITKPQWFSKNGCGYVLETNDKHLVMMLECHGVGKLMIRLQGIDRISSEGVRLPLWVDYTRFAVNDEVIFWEMKPQWHDKSYTYTKPVVDGEKIKVEISWSNHGYKGEELTRLLSLW